MPETGSGGRRGGGVKDSLPFLKALENGHTLIKTFLNVYYDPWAKVTELRIRDNSSLTAITGHHLN